MRFSRSELIFGETALKKLSHTRVAVFGLGGVGGYALEALARAGVGEIDIIDSDTVDVTNINRQLIALTSTVGMKKTEIFRNRIKDINPDCRVNVHDVFYLPERAEEFEFDKFDYVVDAIDTVTAKIDLAVRCTEKGIPIISSMGTGNKLDPSTLQVADISKTHTCPLAKSVRKRLRMAGIEKGVAVVFSTESPIFASKEAVPGSMVFVPASAGLLIASHIVRKLIGV